MTNRRRLPAVRLTLAATVTALVAACPAPRAPREPTPAPRSAEAIRVVDGDVAVFAGDADAGYWFADGHVWRRPWAGPPTALARLAEPALALRIHDRALYAATATTLVAIDVRDGRARPVATALPPWLEVAIDGDGAWFGTGDGVYRAPLGGGAPEQLASGLGAVGSITTDADAIYVIAAATAPEALRFRGFPVQAIVRVAKADGAVRTLAARQFGADDLVRLGPRLYWISRTNPAVASVELATGRRRVELAGTASALTTDGRRLLVGVDQEALAELIDGRGLVAAGAPELALDLIAAGLAVAGDGVLALRRRAADGAASLWWLPRPSRTATPAALVTATNDVPLALAVDDGAAVFALRRDGIRIAPGARAIRIVRFDRANGRSRELARGDEPGAVAVAGARVAFGLDRAVWTTAGAAPPRAVARDQLAVTGLAVVDEHLWWADGDQLWRAALADGAARAIFTPSMRGRSNRYAPAPLITAGAALCFGDLGVGADALRCWRGGQIATVYDPGELDLLGPDLARVGRTLFATTAAGPLVRVPIAGGPPASLPGEDDSSAILRLLGGPALAAIVETSDGTALVDLDLATGRRTRRWAVPGGFGLDADTAVADDHHVYAFLARARWLVAIPR